MESAAGHRDDLPGFKLGMSSDDAALLAVLTQGGPEDDPPPFENVGKIKFFDAERGFGFISCQETFEVYNSDVFIHKKQMNGFQVGDYICFQVRENEKGQPQASDVRPYGPPAPGPSIEDQEAAAFAAAESFYEPLGGQPGFGLATSSADDGRGGDGDSRRRLYHGMIKKYDDDRGFGFIECPERDQDVFLHHSEIRDYRVGDLVQFRIKSKKGKPHAIRLFTGVLAEEESRLPHQGVVKRIDEAKGYGFIFCQPLFDVYSADVFVILDRIQGCVVGDRVEFAVVVDGKGRPQAAEVRKMSNAGVIGAPAPAASAPAPAMGAGIGGGGGGGGGGCGDDGEDEEDDLVRCVGMIKSFSAEHGYGFITGKDAMERFGRDVFLHTKQIKQFEPGDTVSFSVRIANGKPQAYGLRNVPKSISWLGGDSGAPSAAAAAADDDEGGGGGGGASGTTAAAGAASGEDIVEEQEYVGEIKSYSGLKGYGFISCPELFLKFGRDVFMHQSQFEGHSVGSRVRFRAQVKRGQPQAHEVVADLQPSGDAGGGSSSSAPGPVGAEAEALDRRLLRACASARADSPAAVAELLACRADPNARDVTGQTPVMISALNVRHSENKCKLLIEHRADLDAPCYGELTAIEWARERINRKFAAFLEALQRGETVDNDVALETPADEF